MSYIHNLGSKVGPAQVAEMNVHGEIIQVPFRRAGKTYNATKPIKCYIGNTHAWANRLFYDIQPLHPSIQPSGPNQFANVPAEIYKRLRLSGVRGRVCWLDDVPLSAMAANTPNADKQSLALGLGYIDLTESKITYEASDGYDFNVSDPLPADSLGDDILFYVRWFTPRAKDAMIQRYQRHRENVSILLSEGIMYRNIRIDVRDADTKVPRKINIARNALFSDHRIIGITAVNPIYTPCTSKKIVPHEIFKRMFLRLVRDNEEFLGYVPFTMLAGTSIGSQHTGLSLVGSTIDWQKCEILYRPEHSYQTPAYEGYPTQVEFTVAYVTPRHYDRMLGELGSYKNSTPPNYPPPPVEHLNQY
ncbi:MAG: hypothetical protein ACPG5B_06800 [Chitinophagales bacterium]